MHELIGWIGAFLLDTYRMKFPAPADFPGITWTNVESENEVYDRSKWFTTLRPMNTKLKMFVYKL